MLNKYNFAIEPSSVLGEVVAPPSKSFAHRIILAAFLSGEEVTVKNTGNKVTYGSYKQVTSGEYAGLRLAGEEGATFNLGSINLKTLISTITGATLKALAR